MMKGSASSQSTSKVARGGDGDGRAPTNQPRRNDNMRTKVSHHGNVATEPTRDGFHVTEFSLAAATEASSSSRRLSLPGRDLNEQAAIYNFVVSPPPPPLDRRRHIVMIRWLSRCLLLSASAAAAGRGISLQRHETPETTAAAEMLPPFHE